MLEVVVTGIYMSGLPLARDLREFAERGGKTYVDLTQRKRPTQERAANRYGIVYIKFPMPYDSTNASEAADTIIQQQRPVMFACFHGRDRSGAVAELIRERML
jgi:protein tyrosine/serine phosphatase